MFLENIDSGEKEDLSRSSFVGFLGVAFAGERGTGGLLGLSG